MAKKNILKSESFRFTAQYKAICRERDLNSEWRSTENEAILDALRHQEAHPNHYVDILVQQTHRFIAQISREKIKDALKYQ